MRPLVIGVGNRWRCDDGVGPRTLDALAGLDDLDADLLTLGGEPARLVAAWAGRERVVVVDATVAGSPPGTIHVVGPHDLDRLPASAETSSHGVGVAEAVALGRALGQLPDRLLVVGVEPAVTDDGDDLSPPVARALDDLVRLVIEEVSVPCA